MNFRELQQRAVSDMVRHVGQPVTVSLCGLDSFIVCAQYWREHTRVYDSQAGQVVESSVHWLRASRCDFLDARLPQPGDEFIVDGIKFRVAAAPASLGAAVKMRLHLDDDTRGFQPSFEAY